MDHPLLVGLRYQCAFFKPHPPLPQGAGVRLVFSGDNMCAVRKGNASGESSTVKGVWDMPELRTREVEDLLEVFAGLTRPDDVFALLEDLFTVREIKDILAFAECCERAH